MKGTEEHDEIPDKTLSTLKEEADDVEEVDWERIENELDADIEEFHRLNELIGASIILAEMFQQDLITFREYFTLTEYIEEEDRDLGVRLSW